MAQSLRSLMLLSSIALASCGGSETGFEPRNLQTSRVEAFWPATDVRRAYAIRTGPEWQAAWAANEPLTFPPTQRPNVDFSSGMVVGISLGSGSNGCYGLGIRRVVEEEHEIRVEYRYAEPAEWMLCTMSIVALIDFVEVPKSDKPVYFVRTDASQEIPDK